MSKLKRQRAKENFLRNIEGVDKDTIINEIRNNAGNDDLYTFFVKKDAFASSEVDEHELGDFLLKAYSDWYFLHKNTSTKNIRAVKLLSDYNMMPINMSPENCLEMIRSGIYKDTIPMFFNILTNLKTNTLFV